MILSFLLYSLELYIKKEGRE